MNRETAIREIKQNWERILCLITEPAKSRVNGATSYVCPLCGHGKNGDGMTLNKQSKSGLGLKCFGCGFSGDIIDLYMHQSGEQYGAAVSFLANQLGIYLDEYRPEDLTVSRRDPAQTNEEREAPQDFTAYFRECRDRLLTSSEALSYLSARGISKETAHAYWIGFDPVADPAGKGHPAPRIIIPTCSTHYIGRSIDPTIEKKYAKMNNAGATPEIFNAKAIYNSNTETVFVVEGAMDALSIIEAGAAAVALNSAANYNKLIEKVKDNPTEAVFILSLDQDEQGRRRQEDLRKGLEEAGAACVVQDVCCGYKDPNEALQKDREKFFDSVERAIIRGSKKPYNTTLYIDHFMVEDMERVKEVKKTGFQNLDKLSGGLNAGLYAVAASPSIGKTTFCHQMADQLATAGSDVLYFSLEQSRLELVTKSLSRKIAKKDLMSDITSLDIRRGKLSREVTEAATEYKAEVGDRMNIVEGNFDCDISFIGKCVRDYIRRNNVRPVVFVDYLQILQPEQIGNRQQTTKEMVDSSVTALKRLSRDLDLTIIVICSVNRASYYSPIGMDSLKETGGIEYTCDVTWGLQFQCMNEEVFEGGKSIKEKKARLEKAQSEFPRKVEFVCLKNRFGQQHFSCHFNYYPKYDLFIETEIERGGTMVRKKTGWENVQTF